MVKRQSARSVHIDTNVRCRRIYPTEKSSRTLTDLQTVGINVDRDQAIHLARVLLAVAQDWNDIDITAYRFDKRRSDGLYRLTVTSAARSRGTSAKLGQRQPRQDLRV